MVSLGDGFDTPNSTITPVDLAFPARGSDPDFIPPFESIPETYRAGSNSVDIEARRWSEFQATWFVSGLPAATQLVARDGIDPEHAFQHLSVLQGCFGTRHEHKSAAVAWLASRWFREYSLEGYTFDNPPEASHG